MQFLASILLLAVLAKDVSASQQRSDRPNVVVFLIDNLGMGDVGCFGNTTLRTPHIDSICRRGAKLSHHLAQDAMCTPSRAAFLTGRYPVRSGMASNARIRVFNILSATGGLPPNETTFAKVFQQQGYKTALVGKWHLGLHCQSSDDFCHHPNNHGFDLFYGSPLSNMRTLDDDGIEVMFSRRAPYLRYLGSMSFAGIIASCFIWRKVGRWAGLLLLLPAILYPLWQVAFIALIPTLSNVFMKNKEVIEQPINFTNMTQRILGESIGFLKEREEDGKPFLFMLSSLQVHQVFHASEAFQGKSQHGPFGDEVEEMDWSVGQILQALDDLGLANNTLVYITSDHGAGSEDKDGSGIMNGGYNGIFTGVTGQSSQEGGIRVPGAVMMPGKISPGLEVSTPTMLMDIYPTLLELIGAPLPRDRVVDGRSLWPLLKGNTDRSPHRVLFHYCGHKLLAARLIPEHGESIYKLHYAWPRWVPGTQDCPLICHCPDHDWLETPRLFDVTSDPTESDPLDITQAPYSEVVAQIEQAVKTHKEGVEPVVNQFDWSHSVFRPWLHPCCNFPYCRCSESKH